jgi:pilus assembly protein Flp/PilA
VISTCAIRGSVIFVAALMSRATGTSRAIPTNQTRRPADSPGARNLPQSILKGEFAMFHLIGARILAAKHVAVTAVKKFVRGKEEGASLVEYGLLVGLIAMVCIAAITLLGTKIRDMFNTLAGQLP